eukprot:4586774-Heterocapsa_arctica.AAC.1
MSGPSSGKPSRSRHAYSLGSGPRKRSMSSTSTVRGSVRTSSEPASRRARRLGAHSCGCSLL